MYRAGGKDFGKYRCKGVKFMAKMDIQTKWFEGDCPINAVPATLATDFSGTNNDLVFTAKVPGEDFNGWKIVFKDTKEEEQKLEVVYDEIDKEIIVLLATDGDKEIITTAEDIKNAITEIVNVVFAKNNNGTGVVEEFEGTLEDGAFGTVCQDIHVIVEHDGQLYINILPNGKYDANWRKLNLVEY